MASPKALELADLEEVGPGTPVGRYSRLFWQPAPKRPIEFRRAC